HDGPFGGFPRPSLAEGRRAAGTTPPWARPPEFAPPGSTLRRFVARPNRDRRMSKFSDFSGYSGRERRTRKLYVTRNTEYHFNEGLCIAVRQRATGTWLLTHPALHRAISGSVRFNRHLEAYPSLETPRVGEGLLFASDGSDVVTSDVVAI